MQDMRISPKEADDEKNDKPSREAYPYGLTIHLRDEEMEKLSLKAGKIGDKVELTAKAFIKSTSLEAEVEGSEENMTLQITDLELKPVGSKSTAEIMFDA